VLVDEPKAVDVPSHESDDASGIAFDSGVLRELDE
jgi:hypothetical protein